MYKLTQLVCWVCGQVHLIPSPACFVTRVMKVASQYTGRGLVFSVANKKDFQAELEDDYGLGTSDGGELPFVTIRTKMGHKYVMREEFT